MGKRVSKNSVPTLRNPTRTPKLFCCNINEEEIGWTPTGSQISVIYHGSQSLDSVGHVFMSLNSLVSQILRPHLQRTSQVMLTVSYY